PPGPGRPREGPDPGPRGRRRPSSCTWWGRRARERLRARQKARPRMRVAVIVAVAFAGGLALAAFAMAPARDAIDTASLDEPSAPARPMSSSAAKAGIDAPMWAPGDAWRMNFGGDKGVTCWIVVASANESGYKQGVSCGDYTDNVATSLAAFSDDWIGSLTP